MYSIQFSDDAKKSFKKLDKTQQVQVTRAIESRRRNPHIAGSRLAGKLHGRYKIKLRALGLRIIYLVQDKQLLILVIAIGKRENNDVYDDLE